MMAGILMRRIVLCFFTNNFCSQCTFSGLKVLLKNFFYLKKIKISAYTLKIELFLGGGSVFRGQWISLIVEVL